MDRWQAPPLPSAWTDPRRAAIVGRTAEWQHLAHAQLLADRGMRQVVLVCGEAGVGKTRLVAEVAAIAPPDTTVLVGVCRETMGAPYQPLDEPVGALADRLAAGSGVDDERLHASLRGRLEIISGADGGSVESNTTTLRDVFTAALVALRTTLRDGPVLLVLEDLHWAGETALALLRFLVERTADEPLLVVATLRTGQADHGSDLTRLVTALQRVDGVQRMNVRGLDTPAVAEYLALVASVSARTAAGAAAVLRAQTGGNPFLLGEVWRELRSRGGLGALNDLDLQTPDAVGQTIGHRMAELPTAHRMTLALAAVIGDEFAADLLIAVGRRTGRADAATVFAGLEAAIAAGLIEPAGRDRGCYRFPHGLARQAVLDLTSDYQRATANADVAQTLEHEFPATDRLVQRLAHHYLCAATLGHADAATRFLTQAAEIAEHSLAHEEAADLFRSAASTAADRFGRDELRLRAARSYMRAARFSRARALDESVAATAEGQQRVRAAIGFEAASWRTGRPGERSVDLLTDALRNGPADDDHPLRIRALAALGRAHTFMGNADRARELGGAAVSAARRTGDAQLLATTIQIGLQDELRPPDLADKWSRATELTALAEAGGDLRHLGPAAYHRALIAYVRGDAGQLDVACADLDRMVRVTGQPFWEWVSTCLNFGRCYLAGDFAAAERSADHALDVGRTFDEERDTEGPFGLQSFMVRRETGRLEQIRGLITGDEHGSGRWAPGLLALYRELGMREPAGRMLAHVLACDVEQYRHSSTWPAVLAFAADAAIWLRNAAAARTLWPLLVEYRGLNLVGAELSAPFGSADRFLGGLGDLLGEPSTDLLFESALAMDRAMGSPVHEATTLAAFAAHLAGTGREPGRGVLDRATELCDRFSLVRVRHELAALPASRTNDRRPAGLSPREVDVLALLAEGLPNRLIARRLFITENTAANHVRNVLGKIGAGNRTQAAIYAREHGIASAGPPGSAPG